MKPKLLFLMITLASGAAAQEKSASFTTTIVVDQSPKEVFDAITHVKAWWSEEVEGNSQKADDTFQYHYKDIHRCLITMEEVVPGKKVVWHVDKNYFNFTKDKAEWTNTKMIFEISRQGNKTEMRFTHVGLTAEDECFEVCQAGWTNYINGSLYNLITTGKGQPNTREGNTFQAAIEEKL